MNNLPPIGFDPMDIVVALIGVIQALSLFILLVFWQSIKDLKTTDALLIQSVNNVEVLVAGDYVKRSELDAKFNQLFSKLNDISHGQAQLLAEHGGRRTGDV